MNPEQLEKTREYLQLTIKTLKEAGYKQKDLILAERAFLAGVVATCSSLDHEPPAAVGSCLISGRSFLEESKTL